MAAQGTTNEPDDAPHDDGEIFGDDAAIFGDGPEMYGDLELAHKVSSDWRYTGSFVEYVLFPLGIPRPTTGRTSAIVTCDRCGRELLCTVYSMSAVEQARRRLRRITVGTVSVLAVCWLGLLLAFVLDVRDDAMWVVFSVLTGASMVSWPALDWMFFQHNQKTPAHIRYGFETHSLRRPGDTSEYVPAWNEPSI